MRKLCCSRTVAIVAVILRSSSPAYAAEEHMPSMPKIQPKRTYTVQSKEQGEELVEQRGYGDQEPMVRMMNLMMVGGSGYEGMEMDMSGGNHGQGMKMADSHSGMAHEGHAKGQTSSPSAPSYAGPAGARANALVEARLDPNPPKVGPHKLTLDIKDTKSGKSIPKLKLEAQVAMTSMDMGTEHPKVRETKPGTYELKIVFSMNGPWEVRIKTDSSSEKPGIEKSYKFNVGSNEPWAPK